MVFDYSGVMLLSGFELPALRTLERLGDAYGGFGSGGASSLPLFLLAGVIIYGIWAIRRP